MGAPRVAFNHSSFTMALVARLSPSECVLVFRGTKDIWDVLRDVDFFPKALPDCDGCKVHSGFYNGWASLKSLVVDDLAGLGCGNSSLSITGHSLGAAMAALAAYELLTASGVRSSNSSSMRSSVPFASIRRVYTYGQPRTGNGAFASSFADRMDAHRIPHFRVVDYRDAVPHLPLHDMLAEGWVHTAPEVYYNHTQLRDFTLCARKRYAVLVPVRPYPDAHTHVRPLLLSRPQPMRLRQREAAVHGPEDARDGEAARVHARRCSP